jgi:hypothetical protein
MGTGTGCACEQQSKCSTPTGTPSVAAPARRRLSAPQTLVLNRRCRSKTWTQQRWAASCKSSSKQAPACPGAQRASVMLSEWQWCVGLSRRPDPACACALLLTMPQVWRVSL